jgi:NADPH-dependent 2,4-dienoyl-CoA reductase/sulfur reductase-like enzyme/rhodanese-related sulfurtransferase
MKKRILIVGGVAGGASCATRARRLNEEAEIIIFERGSYVSFANCGLPYHVGGVISDETNLIVAGTELFKKRFNIEVRLQSEVVAIYREARELEVRALLTGKLYREKYDALVLAPGAAPIRPPLPGVELPGIFVLRTIPDGRRIRDWIERVQPETAVIVGGGFIGLEMAENLATRGIKVTVLEMLEQLLPPLDPEMAAPIGEHLEAKGVKVSLGDRVAGFLTRKPRGLEVVLSSGAKHAADLVILAMGVRPENELAKTAGLELGDRGGIRIDEQMRTSDPNIWAVGDAVEVRDAVTGVWALMPLAGPANRQGRAAADAICGHKTLFRGVQGSAICEVFGLVAAMTGASEKALKRAGISDFEKVYLHPQQHAAYFPGARRIHLKLLYRNSDGAILGAQAIGHEGVDKRIDVISMAIQKGGTVFDLEEAELCYAPQFGSAKDPVNMAGMIAANSLRDGLRNVSWENVNEESLLLDVREPEEFNKGHAEGATNIPLAELRQRLQELPRLKAIRVYCGVGQRAYNAVRMLRQKGFRVKNLSGGYETYLNFRRAHMLPR